MSDDVKLKPCPFCGCDTPEIYVNSDGLQSVICGSINCFAEGPFIDHEDAAIAEAKTITAWNTRTAANADVDRLVEALDSLHERIQDAWPELNMLPPMIEARAALAAFKGQIK